MCACSVVAYIVAAAAASAAEPAVSDPCNRGSPFRMAASGNEAKMTAGSQVHASYIRDYSHQIKLHPTDSWKLSAMSVPISGSDHVMMVSSAGREHASYISTTT